MTWVLGSFHSSFKHRLLDEFLNDFLKDSWMNVNFKVCRKLKNETIKNMQEIKIML